jgi:hypothetical protein
LKHVAPTSRCARSRFPTTSITRRSRGRRPPSRAWRPLGLRTSAADIASVGDNKELAAQVYKAAVYGAHSVSATDAFLADLAKALGVAPPLGRSRCRLQVGELSRSRSPRTVPAAKSDASNSTAAGFSLSHRRSLHRFAPVSQGSAVLLPRAKQKCVINDR